MTDLISRSAARELVRKAARYVVVIPETGRGYDGAVLIDEIMHGFNKIPAVDAVPVVHASWVSEVVTKKDWKGRTNHYYQPCSCSACHEPAFREYKYCPYCGARMDGEENASD